MSIDVDIDRLCQAMKNASLVLRRPRQERVNMVRQFVGAHWSEEGAVNRVPCNLLASYVSVVLRKLIANTPAVMLSTENKKYRPAVGAMEGWMNKELKKPWFIDMMSRLVQDSLFSIGIAKVSISNAADASLTGWQLKAGDPFMETIDLDDFVFDIHAKSLWRAGYIGHRVRWPLEVVRRNKMFSKARKELSSDPDSIFNMEGDERIGVLGRTTLGGESEEYEDFVDLWEVYMPRHRKIITLHGSQVTGAQSDSMKGKALRIQNWIGPDWGPYYFLGMMNVPGNAMPKAPLQDLYDLHLAINNILRKLIRQAERQKSNLFYSAGNESDAERITSANDGEAVRVDHPEQLKDVVRNVPNPETQQLFMMFKELFNWLAGNLEIMGGLSPQSRTAAQDELMAQNSSATISEMQERVVGVTKRVLEGMLWFHHHHPTKTYASEKALNGMPSISVMRTAGPQDRQQIDFEEINLSINPYSLPHQTPQTRMAALQQIMTQTIIPLMPLLQQSGTIVDIQAYLGLAAKYNDMPDLDRIVTLTDVNQNPGSEGGGGMPEMGKPGETTRNYVRRSMGQNSPGAKNKTMMDNLSKMSGNGSANGAA